MSDQTKFLKLAQTAREEGNAENAKKYYELAYEDMPDNPEVKWFASYYSLLECKNIEAASKFINLCSALLPTLRLVANIADEYEKKALGKVILDTFLPLQSTVHIATLKVSGDTRALEKATNPVIRALGDDIIELFGETEPYIGWSVFIWKHLIDRRHRYTPYRNFSDKGKELWFDEMAKKIQKYEPDYVMPQFKQAGCITLGETACRARPGE